MTHRETVGGLLVPYHPPQLIDERPAPRTYLSLVQEEDYVELIIVDEEGDPIPGGVVFTLTKGGIFHFHEIFELTHYAATKAGLAINPNANSIVVAGRYSDIDIDLSSE